jgi:four helix bundle protein
LDIIRLYVGLQRNDVTRVIGGQFLRSGTSVGAHYREGCRARSDAEFISKLEGGMQELEKTLYWLELLLEFGQCQPNLVDPLIAEANEIMSMLVAIVRKRKGGS